METGKHILFDLDGTLTDSKLGITRGVQRALKHFGIEVTDPNDLRGYIGPPLMDSFTSLHNLTEAQATEAIRVYREYYTTRGIMEHEVYNGIPELLRALAVLGKKIYVATSKPTVFAEKMLKADHLDYLFTGVFGSYLDGRRTAKAEVIEAVLEHHGLSPAHTIMVGDRSHDVIGAKKHGIFVIGVLYGYGSRDELTEAGADLLVPDVPSLGAALGDL